MSRSRKGRKGVGLEWDRRREGESGWTTPGEFAKRVGKRAQRRIGKKTIKKELKDADGTSE